MTIITANFPGWLANLYLFVLFAAIYVLLGRSLRQQLSLVTYSSIVYATSAVALAAVMVASGTAFSVNGSNPIVTYQGSITQNNAARVVDIQNTTGGSKPSCVGLSACHGPW